MLYLPAKFILDGSRKVQITCGPRGCEPVYMQALGASNYYFEEFDFSSYSMLPPELRERVILDALRDSFTDILRRHNAPERISEIESSCNSVHECNFRAEINAIKLRKQFSSSKVTVSVFRVLNRDDNESWRCDVTSRTGSLLYSDWIGRHPSVILRSSMYKRSTIEGSVFRIISREGRIEYELNLDRFL